MVYISGGNELLNPQKILKRLGLKNGMKVGDLGCGGAGHFTIPAAKMVESEGLVYAVDILKSVLHSVASRGRLEGVTNIKTVWSNLETLGATNIPDSSLNAALIINILFQSKHHSNILREAMRLIKSDGKILVIDWEQTGGSFGPPAVDRVKSEKVKSTAKQLGLKLIEEFEAGKNHYGLIFQK